MLLSVMMLMWLLFNIYSMDEFLLLKEDVFQLKAL